MRELENCIERAVALARFDQVTVDDLPEKIRAYRADRFVLAADHAEEVLTLDELERRYIQRVLTLVAGNKSRAAELLGLDRRTLYRKLERWEEELGRTGSPTVGPLMSATPPLLSPALLERTANDIRGPAGLVNFLLDEVATIAETKAVAPELVARARRGVIRLLRIANRLSRAAQLESEKLVLTRERFELLPLVRACVELAKQSEPHPDIVVDLDAVDAFAAARRRPDVAVGGAHRRRGGLHPPRPHARPGQGHQPP